MDKEYLNEIRSRMDEPEFVQAYLPKRRNFYVDIGASHGGKDSYGSSTTLQLHDKNWDGVCFETDLHKFEMLLSNQKNTNVTKINSRVTPDNVLAQLKGVGVPKFFDFLSLDIDGYDYFVLEALLKEFRPSLICCEINEKIPPPIKFSVLFDEKYFWAGNDFYGFSISMLENLCNEHSYSVVDLCYNNAFMVPCELDLFDKRSIENIYKQGYADAPNRRSVFHYNEHLQNWLDLPPEESIKQIENYFNEYQGKFLLEI